MFYTVCSWELCRDDRVKREEIHPATRSENNFPLWFSDFHYIAKSMWDAACNIALVIKLDRVNRHYIVDARPYYSINARHLHMRAFGDRPRN